MKRRNKISGNWSPRLIEMLESPAYRALSLPAHRVISRIEIELGHHGGNENGRLPVTKQDFLDYGIYNDAIAPAIRETEALGFVRVTQRGKGGNAEHRQPNLFLLTFAHGRDSRSNPPKHDWRKIKTIEEAEAIAQAARADKDARAAALGRRSRSGKPGPKPVTETMTENINSPVRKLRTTGSVRLSGLQSISRGGGGGRRRRLLATQHHAGNGNGDGRRRRRTRRTPTPPPECGYCGMTDGAMTPYHSNGGLHFHDACLEIWKTECNPVRGNWSAPIVTEIAVTPEARAALERS
jgi:hypothetical protein